jgi:hypothetical protein
LSENSSEKDLNKIILETVKEEKPQSVEALVASVKEKTSVPEDEVVKAVLNLHDNGMLTLKDQVKPLPTSFATYLGTGRVRWYWLTIVLASAAALVVYMVPEDWVPFAYARYVLGAIFVLWLPGYTCTKALFPSKVGGKGSMVSVGLDSAERVGLSFGLSLALVAFMGLILNYTPYGVTLIPIIFSLLAFTLVCATVGLIREYRPAT